MTSSAHQDEAKVAQEPWFAEPNLLAQALVAKSRFWPRSTPAPVREDWARPPDVERLATNAARFIEQGGRALAAYLKPFEAADTGQIKRNDTSDLVVVALTAIGKVAEHWSSDPVRLAEAQAAIATPFMQLWAQTYRRMLGEDGRPGRARRQGRQALRGARMGRPAALRFPAPGARHRCRLGGESGRALERARPAHAGQGQVLPAPDRQRDCHRRTSSPPTPSCCARRWRRAARIWSKARFTSPRTWRPAAASCASARRIPRSFEFGVNVAATPGKSGVPQRADGADSVLADDGQHAGAPATHHPAVDQQVLHHGSVRREEPGALDRRAGRHGVHGVVGQPRRAPPRQDLRILHARGHLRRARRGEGGDGRGAGQRDRLLRRRHAAVDRARLHGKDGRRAASAARPSSPRRPTSPMPATSRSSSTRSS